MSDFYDDQAYKMFWKDTPKMNEAIEKQQQKDILKYPETLGINLAIPAKDHINPNHYKDIVPGMQYMEMMVHMLANKVGVEAHLFGQVYKYLFRCGAKDLEVQELKKAKWYLDALIKWQEEGKVL
jgi:hypothetical protein